MTIDAKTTILWAVALLLFLASAWSMNNATFFLFAADFPGEYRHLYESRGTHFFVLAITLFVGSAWIVVAIIRSRKKVKP